MAVPTANTKIRALNLQDFFGAKVWCEILAIRRCHPQTSRGSRVRSVGYSANQISTTSGGSTGIRSDRTKPGGNIARMPGNVSASSRYGDAVDVASRAA